MSDEPGMETICPCQKAGEPCLCHEVADPSCRCGDPARWPPFGHALNCPQGGSHGLCRPTHVNEHGVFVADYHPARDREGVCGNCGAEATEFHRDGCWTTLPSR